MALGGEVMAGGIMKSFAAAIKYLFSCDLAVVIWTSSSHGTEMLHPVLALT